MRGVLNLGLFGYLCRVYVRVLCFRIPPKVLLFLNEGFRFESIPNGRIQGTGKRIFLFAGFVH